MTTLQTTTDSQSNLEHALSEDWRTPLVVPKEKPEPSESVKEYIEARNEEEAQKKAEGPEFLKDDPDREHKAHAKQGNGYTKRIDKLTRNWRTEQAARVAAENRARELELKLNGGAPEQATRTEETRTPATSSQNTGYLPGSEKYPDFAEAIKEAERANLMVSERAAKAIRAAKNPADITYFLARNPEVCKELLYADDATQRVGEISRDLQNLHENFTRTAQQESSRQQGLWESHNSRVAAALNSESDAAELYQAAGRMPINQAVGMAVLEQDNSEQVVIYLARNPSVLSELNQLPPSAAMSRVGRIAAQIEGTRKAGRAKPAEPISPVGASSTRSSLPLDQLPPGEYIKIRNRQEREHRRLGR